MAQPLTAQPLVTHPPAAQPTEIAVPGLKCGNCNKRERAARCHNACLKCARHCCSACFRPKRDYSSGGSRQSRRCDDCIAKNKQEASRKPSRVRHKNEVGRKAYGDMLLATQQLGGGGAISDIVAAGARSLVWTKSLAILSRRRQAIDCVVTEVARVVAEAVPANPILSHIQDTFRCCPASDGSVSVVAIPNQSYIIMPMTTWLGHKTKSQLESLASKVNRRQGDWYIIYEGATQRRSKRYMQYCDEDVRRVLAPFLSDLSQLLPRGFTGEARSTNPDEMTATFLLSECGCEEQGKPDNDGNYY
jgi:hypothetical protein